MQFEVVVSQYMELYQSSLMTVRRYHSTYIYNRELYCHCFVLNLL